MKVRTAAFTLILLLAAAAAAHAGILGTAGAYIKGEAVSVIIGAAIGALGMLGASYKLWGVAAKELGEFAWMVFKAVQPGGPGGKQITQAEMQGIVKEAADIYPAVAKAIASHKRG